MCKLFIKMFFNSSNMILKYKKYISIKLASEKSVSKYFLYFFLLSQKNELHSRASCMTLHFSALFHSHRRWLLSVSHLIRYIIYLLSLNYAFNLSSLVANLTMFHVYHIYDAFIKRNHL